MRWLLAFALLLLGAADPPATLYRPARVFDAIDGIAHEGWTILVRGDRIVAVGSDVEVPPGTRVIELPGTTLMPGLIEGHGHLFLHPYDEAKWDDQVLHEPLALRTARAVVAARATLMAGFTTERDLGTEGAGYADVGLRQAIEQGIVPGPRLLVATRAIVARGAYGPKGYEPGVAIPQGAEEASGVDEVVRAQIAAGADVVNGIPTQQHRPNWLATACAKKRIIGVDLPILKAAVKCRCGGGTDTSQEAPEGNADRAQGLGHRLRNSQAQPFAPPHQLPPSPNSRPSRGSSDQRQGSTTREDQRRGDPDISRGIGDTRPKVALCQ